MSVINITPELEPRANTSSAILETAWAAREAGLCAFPVQNDGTKAPDAGLWGRFSQRHPDVEEFKRFGFETHDGLGLMAGPLSHLDCLDFDTNEVFEDAMVRAHGSGLGPLMERLVAGYCDATPGGGRRILVSYPPDIVWKRTVFAQRPKRPEERKNDQDLNKILVELPNFAIIAPSHGRTHPLGTPYVHLSGSLTAIASYDADERASLFDLFRSFDERIVPDAAPRRPQPPRPPGSPERPGDAFMRQTTWPELMDGASWMYVYDHGEKSYWRRPGKDRGISASTNAYGWDKLRVFSTSTEFSTEKSYDRFAFYATREHGGDFSRAASALRKRGYGRSADGPDPAGCEETTPPAADAPPGDQADTPPTAPPVSLADALDQVRVFMRRFLRLTDDEVTIIAVWIGMTHAIEAFYFAAYLHITSPLPECGKSRLLEVLELLVRKAWLTSRVSAAVLMRKVDQEQPTLLLDESDAAFSGDEQYAEALRGLLNAGFHREGKASCCVGQGANLAYKDFSVFGPKAIAGIGRLPSTVESRSIPITMKRRTKREWIEKFRRRDVGTVAGVIRDQLAAALAGHLVALRASRPTMPEGLSDRAEDVLEPLFAIAEAAGGTWPTDVAGAAAGLMGAAARASREADQNLGLELLADIQQVFNSNPEKMALATKLILARLAALEDRPWATFGKGEKPITGHRLARILKGFEIQPAGTIREGDETFKGYRLAAFEEAFARYLGFEASQGNKPNRNGPESPKTEASHEEAVTLSKTADHPDKHWVCDAVTLSNPDHEDNGPRGGVFQAPVERANGAPNPSSAAADDVPVEPGSGLDEAAGGDQTDREEFDI